MNRRELKRLAREQLGGSIFKNNWLLSVLVVLIFGAILSAASSLSFVLLILVGPICVGFMDVFKNLKRFGTVKIEKLFSGFTNNFTDSFILGIMTDLFIILWSLLFIIPGIVKFYEYSMAYYLKSEHTDWHWRKCLQESKALTNGHKMELFILDLSFIGWHIVGALCFGIGTLWVEAYRHQTFVNYYEELSALRVEG